MQDQVLINRLQWYEIFSFNLPVRKCIVYFIAKNLEICVLYSLNTVLWIYTGIYSSSSGNSKLKILKYASPPKLRSKIN